jgi:YVTN family beta-propeller protein
MNQFQTADRPITNESRTPARRIGMAALFFLVPTLALETGTAGASGPARDGRACSCAAAPTPVRYGPLLRPPTINRAPYAGLPGGPAKAMAKLYVADELSGTVSVIDANTRLKIGAIQVTVRVPIVVPFSPLDIAVAPDGRTVWVTAPQPQSGCAGGDPACGDAPIPPEYAIDEVVVLDPNKDSIIARIKVPSLDTGMVHVSGIVIDRESQFAYVTATAANQIIKIDARTFEVVGRVDLGPGREPDDITICGSDLVVANGFGGKSLSVVSTQTGAVDEVPLKGVPLQITCSADGRFAWASLFDTREVVRYELATGALTRIALPEGAQGPVQLLLTPDERRLYVCDQGTFFGRMPSDKLYEIDVATAKVMGEITVGRGPTGIVLTEGGSRAFVTSFLSASVSVVDMAKRRVAPAAITVGTGPKGIGYWQGPSLVQ